MYGYRATATFMGASERPCLHRTALCPDRCAHATTTFAFRLETCEAIRGADSANAKWVTPLKAGDEHCVGLADLGEHAEAARRLEVGQRVALQWRHEYVTREGASFPERPVHGLAAL